MPYKIQNLAAFKRACAEFLSLREKVSVRSRKHRVKFFPDAEGVYYYRENRGHLVEVLQNASNVKTIIAHEYVHAWQQENGMGLDKKAHGLRFQEKAAELKAYLVVKGYAIGPIFRAGVDL